MNPVALPMRGLLVVLGSALWMGPTACGSTSEAGAPNAAPQEQADAASIPVDGGAGLSDASAADSSSEGGEPDGNPSDGKAPGQDGSAPGALGTLTVTAPTVACTGDPEPERLA